MSARVARLICTYLMNRTFSRSSTVNFLPNKSASFASDIPTRTSKMGNQEQCSETCFPTLIDEGDTGPSFCNKAWEDPFAFEQQGETPPLTQEREWDHKPCIWERINEVEMSQECCEKRGEQIVANLRPRCQNTCGYACPSPVSASWHR